MKDNIESKSIGNRKIIIELRFDHKVIVSDKKGEIIEKINELHLFNPYQWEFGVANVHVYDNEKKEESMNDFFVDLSCLRFVSAKIDSVEKFYNDFEKLYSCVENIIGKVNIRRIGCRIIGTYYTKSQDFKTIFEGIKNSFPSKFFLQEYPATDLLFNLVYKNGMYNIGPVKDSKEVFVEKNFGASYRKNHVGIAIDTDNYLTNEKEPINEKKLIKDVFILSLSVEKDLYTNLKDL